MNIPHPELRDGGSPGRGRMALAEVGAFCVRVAVVLAFLGSVVMTTAGASAAETNRAGQLRSLYLPKSDLPPPPDPFPDKGIPAEPGTGVSTSAPAAVPASVGTESVATNAVASGVAPAVEAAASRASAAMDELDDKHRLAIGDRISFRIVEDEEDPLALLVRDSGDIEVPHIGRFPATGRTCRELSRILKVELEKEYYFQATVIIAVDLKARSRGKVYIVGPVRAPGPQEIPSDEVLTVSKAILRAGGFLDVADKKAVRITRKRAGEGGDEILTVNVVDILEKGRSDADLVLQPGDLIYIPERLIRF